LIHHHLSSSILFWLIILIDYLPWISHKHFTNSTFIKKNKYEMRDAIGDEIWIGKRWYFLKFSSSSTISLIISHLPSSIHHFSSLIPTRINSNWIILRKSLFKKNNCKRKKWDEIIWSFCLSLSYKNVFFILYISSYLTINHHQPSPISHLISFNHHLTTFVICFESASTAWAPMKEKRW